MIKALKKPALDFTEPQAPLDEIHAPAGTAKADIAEPVKVLWSWHHMDTLTTYGDSPFRLLIPISADTRSFARGLLKLYHH